MRPEDRHHSLVSRRVVTTGDVRFFIQVLWLATSLEEVVATEEIASMERIHCTGNSVLLSEESHLLRGSVSGLLAQNLHDCWERMCRTLGVWCEWLPDDHALRFLL